MLFVHRVPAPPLDRFIASIWFCENEPGPFALERLLPSGAAQLVVNLKEDQTRAYHPGEECEWMTTSSGTVLAGASSRYSVIDTAEQECVAGVAFRPGGMAAFFSVPAHETLDTDIPLEMLWGRPRAQELRERLQEAAGPAARLDALEHVMWQTFRAPGLHPVVTFALHQFEERPEVVRIRAVADRTGLSAKRFIERFKSTVGVTPKHYCRILRFQRALAQAEAGRRVEWTRIAMESGYFDQAHFIRDFRSFAGITPTGYEADRTQFRNHVKFVQSDGAARVR
jgi:AraC-like DNA-binding protein